MGGQVPISDLPIATQMDPQAYFLLQNVVDGVRVTEKISATDLSTDFGAMGDMSLNAVQTVTGAKTFGSAGAVGKLKVAGSTSGSTIIDATPVAGSGTVTLPTTGTLATLAGVETFTNKTFVAPVLGAASATSLTLSTPLAVAQGGIGRATQTAYAVLCGGTTATGAQQSIANVGTSGQVLTSNGAGALPTFQALPTGSTSQAGIVELDTDAEMWAFSDQTRYTNAYQLGLATNPTEFLSRRFIFWDDFLGVPHTVSSGLVSVVEGGGTVTILDNPDNAHVGVLNLATGTATTDGCRVRTNTGVIMVSGGVTTFESLVYIPNLIDGSDIYVVTAGFHDISDTGVGITDGIYFLYSNASANRQRCTENNGTQTATASSTAVAANTRVRLKIVVNAGGTSAEFFVDDVSIGSNTTNIPTTRTVGFGVALDKNGGTTTRSLYVDYIGASCLFTSQR